MDLNLSKDDVKRLLCALTLYMEKMHLAIQVKQDDVIFVPNVIFERHIESLSNFHDLQNRLLELLDKDSL